MKDDEPGPNLTTEGTKKGSQVDFAQRESSEKARWFLIYLAAVLAVLGCAVFLVTKDFRVLVGDSIFALPIFVVYKYYFTMQDKL